MAIALRSFQSTRVLLILAVLALLAVVLMLAAPHLASAVQSLIHTATSGSGAQPTACGTLPGSCNTPQG